jgi:hypothetical protein
LKQRSEFSGIEDCCDAFGQFIYENPFSLVGITGGAYCPERIQFVTTSGEGIH